MNKKLLLKKLLVLVPTTLSLAALFAINPVKAKSGSNITLDINNVITDAYEIDDNTGKRRYEAYLSDFYSGPISTNYSQLIPSTNVIQTDIEASYERYKNIGQNVDSGKIRYGVQGGSCGILSSAMAINNYFKENPQARNEKTKSYILNDFYYTMMDLAFEKAKSATTIYTDSNGNLAPRTDSNGNLVYGEFDKNNSYFVNCDICYQNDSINANPANRYNPNIKYDDWVFVNYKSTTQNTIPLIIKDSLEAMGYNCTVNTYYGNEIPSKVKEASKKGETCVFSTYHHAMAATGYISCNVSTLNIAKDFIALNDLASNTYNYSFLPVEKEYLDGCYLFTISNIKNIIPSISKYESSYYTPTSSGYYYVTVNTGYKYDTVINRISKVTQNKTYYTIPGRGSTAFVSTTKQDLSFDIYSCPSYIVNSGDAYAKVYLEKGNMYEVGYSAPANAYSVNWRKA